jgi:hypothetical protein
MQLSILMWLLLTVAPLAMRVGVPVVPGTPGPVGDYTEGEDFIKEYGFPGESLLGVNPSPADQVTTLL